MLLNCPFAHSVHAAVADVAPVVLRSSLCPLGHVGRFCGLQGVAVPTPGSSLYQPPGHNTHAVAAVSTLHPLPALHTFSVQALSVHLPAGGA